MYSKKLKEIDNVSALLQQIAALESIIFETTRVVGQVLGHYQKKEFEKIEQPLTNLYHQYISCLQSNTDSAKTVDKQLSRMHDVMQSRFPELSSQEAYVCIYLRLGFSTPDIAQLLFCSVRTIESHRYNIRRKLGLASNDDIKEFLQKNTLVLTD